MKRIFHQIKLTKFIAIFITSLLIMGIIWETNIHNQLYHCTDEAFLNFLTPGSWVHGDYVFKEKITISATMSEPDSIKTGWTETKLLALWLCMVGFSFSLSLFLSIKKTN